MSANEGSGAIRYGPRYPGSDRQPSSKLGAVVFGCADGSPVRQVKEKYDRGDAEKRFARVYETVSGRRCAYCGMPNDGEHDHQPPLYVLHRFADGGLVTARQVREAFGQCRLVPCCTICSMGLGAYHGSDDDDRREEIMRWFLLDERRPQDRVVFGLGAKLLADRLDGVRGGEIYEFPGVGRFIYVNALAGIAEGAFDGPDAFPEWLTKAQVELAEWLRGVPGRKEQYFLAMANLRSYELPPHAGDGPRGQFESSRRDDCAVT